ncbi:flagellar basal body-associated FliL family protein [Methylomonas sp. LL1]|uniref:flagellar basal body-associated FliL family protein n=1 Tax=Methylomonas sp. LL1 TaxID=2785785 RepID=UPI0018C36DBD|nr:flagellar basal body-associated FliL family protein [Methylomonas sp. LL1]QPK63926.1 flagellar basal body-associated FliL family protein [Methylomonas sp. LL1]
MRKVILLAAMLLMPAIAISSEQKADEAAGPVVEYVEMTPKFTVNLAEPKKYLLVNIQLLVEGAEHVEKVKKNMPMLRHQIIMMFSGMQVADLQTMEQREALRIKTKEMLTESLTKIHGNEGFQDVFFSEFLVN